MGNEAVVNLLLERDDVEVRSKDSQDRTPYWWADYLGNKAIKRLLTFNEAQPGRYYIRPSLGKISTMSFEQKKKVPDVVVGRKNCGFVTFNQAVNLNEVPVDHLFGEIAQIAHRSLTIYPDAATKPLVGKGLNLPLTIYLYNA